jgi:hypothetical protein
MSRRTQKFTWTVRKVAAGYECQCENLPGVKGVGPTEQWAINDAREKVTVAAEKAEIGTDPR